MGPQGEKECSVSGCVKAVRGGRGLCEKHNSAMRTYGHPLGKLYAEHGDRIVAMQQLVGHAFPEKPNPPLTVRIGATEHTVTERHIARFYSNIEVQDDGRWIWGGALNPYGYGLMWIDRKGISAHRFSYQVLVGRIPDGLDLDHIRHNEAYRRGECGGGLHCRHRREVDPAGLVPRGRAENVSLGARERPRGDTCKRGHALSGENLSIGMRGGRIVRRCRACRNQQAREAAARRRAAARPDERAVAARAQMREEAARRYREGETLKTIADSLGRSSFLVRALLVEAGVPIRLRGGWPSEGDT